MDKKIMLMALQKLDEYLKKPAELLIGGGAAMVLAYNVPIATLDIDGLLMRSEVTPAELDLLIKKIGKDLNINSQWFNSYFNTYTFTVPQDFRTRLKIIFEGRNLKVYAMGLEDLLVMKCFAGREKDIGHAKGLIKKGADIDFVDEYIQSLVDKEIPGAEEALDFFDDIKDQLGK